MPADQVQIDVSLVRRLVAAQFPEWADLPIRPVSSGGWDNRTFHSRGAASGLGSVGWQSRCRTGADRGRSARPRCSTFVLLMLSRAGSTCQVVLRARPLAIRFESF
jgi:hypothetical protein